MLLCVKHLRLIEGGTPLEFLPPELLSLGSAAANLGRLRFDLMARPGLLVPAEIRQERLEFPRWLRVVRPLLKRGVAAALRERFERSGRDALSQLASELRTWAGRVLDDLGRQFAAQADPVRTAARLRAHRGETARPTTPIDPDDLQMLEQLVATTEPARDGFLDQAGAPVLPAHGASDRTPQPPASLAVTPAAAGDEKVPGKRR